MTSDRVVRLTFPAKSDYLLLARLALSGLSRQLHVDDELIADLKLAVTEACGNAVRHAYTSDDGPVYVAFVVSGDRLQMIVEDQGTGLGGSQPLLEPSSEPLESGMGMPIIRAIVDEVEIGSGADGRGTVLRMTKYLPAVAV